MKKYLSAFLMLTVIATACKKKEPSQASTWSVKGEKFTAVSLKTIGKAAAVLSSDDAHNRFIIFLNFSYFPTDGTLIIGTPSAFRDVNISFYYHDNYYIPLHANATMDASVFNNKAYYSLPPLYFFNYYDHSDSVLISGDFYEP